MTDKTTVEWRAKWISMLFCPSESWGMRLMAKYYFFNTATLLYLSFDLMILLKYQSCSSVHFLELRSHYHPFFGQQYYSHFSLVLRIQKNWLASRSLASMWKWMGYSFNDWRWVPHISFHIPRNSTINYIQMVIGSQYLFILVHFFYFLLQSAFDNQVIISAF